MKKIIFVAIVVFTFSCAPHKLTVSEFIPEATGGSACPKPLYVITMSKEGAEPELSLYNLLKDAQTRHGLDVTIQNVRWDEDHGVKIAAIYDVIRCNPDTIK